MRSSRFAFGSGARFGGVRRRLWDDEDVRVLRSVLRGSAFGSAVLAEAVVAAVAPPPAAVVFLRLRPPRVPRRRFFGAVVLDCPSPLAGVAGVSTVSDSTWGSSGARVSGAWSSDFLRRKNDSGKRSLL
jgi:hypothetical protein